MSTSQLFNADLIALQGVLLSSDNVQSFAALTAKGGNEKKIAFVIDTVKNFLKRENYIKDDGVMDDTSNKMQLFALYIVLNSNLPVLNELVSGDSSIDHLIWTVPTITQCLMCEMLWKLSMGKFAYEIVTFSWPQLSLEVADALIKNMKYFNPTECLKELQLLSIASFRLLCRINLFEFDNNQLHTACNNFLRCMMYFCNPPNEYKLEQLRKDDLYKYYGNCLFTMLMISHECFNQYNSTQTNELDKSIEIYGLTYIKDSIKKPEYKPSECSNKSVLETLNKCFEDLLDKCRKLVMGVNVDIFCAWSEFEEGNKTMQESIGELCYKVCQQYLHSHLSDHPVVSMLEQISRKPVNVQEIINTTESSVIIENVNKNNNESIQWLQALMYRDNLCEDIPLLEMLEANLNKLHEDDCYKLFQRLYADVNNCTENKELIQLLAIKTYQLCNETVKMDIANSHFKDKCFNNHLESEQFASMLTEIFNKLAISTESELSSVLNVFVQNPRDVYIKIFKSAIENNQQMKLMLKVVTYLERYSTYFYNEDAEPCLTIILKNTIEELHTEAKQDHFINFVFELKNAGIISGSKLLLLIVMPMLHSALVKKNNCQIYIQCCLLFKCYSKEELLEYRAPMLAMLGQILASVRWKIDTYNDLAPLILKIVIDLQTSLMETYNQKIPEIEVFWLKNKLKDVEPLNMYYFRQLWDPPGNNFVEVISGIHIHKNMEIELLPMWLAQVLCSSIGQEWNLIWNSLKIFEDSKILELFHSAILSVLKAEKNNRTTSTWACMLYCYKNLINCIRYQFFKEPLTDVQVTLVLNKMISTINYIEEDYIEQFGTVALPLFAYIVQRKKDYTIDVSETLRSHISHSKLITSIDNLFANGAK